MLGLSALLLVALLVWSRKLEHDRIEAEETSRLSVQARAIEQNLERQLAAVNRVLLDARADLKGWPQAQRAARMNERLALVKGALPGVQAWRWQDAQGQLLAGSERDPGGDGPIARDAAAWAQTDRVASVLHVSAPLRSNRGTYTQILSLAVMSPAGAFDGTLSAALDTEYFSTLFGSVLYAPDMRTALVHDNGQVILRNPDAGSPAPASNLNAPGTLFSRHRQSGQPATVQTGFSAAIGDERVMALRTLQAPELHLDAPLVLSVSRNRDALYTAWAGENTALAAGVICVYGLSTWVLLASQRQRDRDEQQAVAARAQHAAEAQRLVLALRGADLALWDLDVKAGVATVNDRWATMLGYKPGDVKADSEGWQALLHPEDRDRVVAAQEDHLGGRTSLFEATYRMRHREGHWIWVLDRGRVVERDAAGQAVRMVGTHMDVSESRREQQQLRLLQASVARLNDVVVITEAEPLEEPGPRIVFVNDAFERVTGWPREAVLGRSPRLLQGPLTDAAELARIDRAQRQRQAVRAELQHYTRQGDLFWVQVEIVPLFDADGTATHLVAVHRDITGRKRAEAAAEQAQRELAATLAAVPDLLFDIDIEGRVHGHHSPRSDLLLVPLADQIGRTVAEVLPPAAASVIMQGLREAEAAGSSAGLQYELSIAGQTHWFEMSVSRKAAAGYELPRFVMLARDITERKQGESERRQLERHLREAQKMESIGTLAGGIAHDFNNILAAILGNVALAQGDLPAGHPAALSLQQINRAGLRARSLVQQILTFSRRQPQALEVQDIGPVVEETLAMLRVTLPAGVRLETRLSRALLRVKADATQLQQVLMNLCTNAWHALPEGQGRVEVGLRAVPRAEMAHASFSGGLQGPCVHLWVSDDGAGMDAATRERIFDPFFTTKPVGQGTGLGLSVVHGIVRGHGGALAVDSAPGQGSTFHLVLPLAKPELAGQALAERAGPGPTDRLQTGRHLLYVDDDEVMTLMVQRLLQRAGYRVSVCSEASQALAFVGSEPGRYDLVVSDQNMPGMTGTELAAQLSRVQPGLPIIISTGFITEALREQASHSNVAAVLQKEHTLDELPALVAQVLSRRR